MKLYVKQSRASALEQLRKPVDLKSLPRRKARVEIARDVLAALDIGKIKPEAANGYVAFDEWPGRSKPVVEGDLRDLLGEMKSCEVCAVGAALVSVAARDNDFNRFSRANVWRSNGRWQVNVWWDQDAIVDRLAPFFNEHELACMEAYFEMTSEGPLCSANYDALFLMLPAEIAEKVSKLPRTYAAAGATVDSDTKRFIIFYTALIENKGAFPSAVSLRARGMKSWTALAPRRRQDQAKRRVR